MIENFKKYLSNNRQQCIIGAILFLYLIFITWVSFSDMSVWWDEAVYIGMGKYIATGGTLGMWEIFRPPFLPLIYAFLFKLNIPLIFAGKMIVIFSSVFSLYLVYLISELIKKGSGVFSSIFLMITPIFVLYSRVPMTDIISIFFVLLTIFLFIKQKYLLTGVCISLVFLSRFPQGLILLPIGIASVFNTYNNNYKLWFKQLVINIFLVILGFFILVIPYLISNYLLYGNILEPFILAEKAVSLSSELYDLGLFYYGTTLFKVAPFLYLALLAPIIYLKKDFFYEPKDRRNYAFIIITTLIFIFYFFWQSHKELRYSLAFIPYLTILSGISFFYILKYFKKEKLFISLFIIAIIIFIFRAFPYYKDNAGYDYITFNNYIDTLNGKYISTTPIPVVFGKINILSLFESRKSFVDRFNKNINSLDGIIIKDCDIFCKNKSKLCYTDLDFIYKEISNSTFKKIYETTIDKCTFSIYKK